MTQRSSSDWLAVGHVHVNKILSSDRLPAHGPDRDSQASGSLGEAEASPGQGSVRANLKLQVELTSGT